MLLLPVELNAIDAFKTALTHIPANNRFRVTDVVPTQIWQALSRPSKHTIGKYIRQNQHSFGIIHVGRNASRHALYEISA